jgi:DNA-directed RNA polymerase specialized sigma24 family protein
MFDLDLEDQQVMDQALRTALPMWSGREKDCFILQLLGYSQEQAAGMLGISQPAVCQYLACAMGKVREIAKSAL